MPFFFFFAVNTAMSERYGLFKKKIYIYIYTNEGRKIILEKLNIRQFMLSSFLFFLFFFCLFINLATTKNTAKREVRKLPLLIFQPDLKNFTRTNFFCLAAKGCSQS